MEIFKITGIGIVTSICVLILKESKTDIAMIVGISGGCLILICTLDYFIDIFSVLTNFLNSSGVPSFIYSTIFKIIGIGYIADFSAGVVEDMGQKALAEKITLAGKLIIMGLSLPIIMLLYDSITELLQ